MLNINGWRKNKHYFILFYSKLQSSRLRYLFKLSHCIPHLLMLFTEPVPCFFGLVKEIFTSYMLQNAEYQRWWVGAHVHLPGSRHPLHVRVSRWRGRRRWQVRTTFFLNCKTRCVGSALDPDSSDIRIGNLYPDPGRQKWSGAGQLVSPSWRSKNKYIAIFYRQK